VLESASIDAFAKLSTRNPVMPTFSRRRFVEALLASSASASFAGSSAFAQEATVNAAAGKPSEPTRPAYFKLSLAAYSFRQYLTGDSPRMTLDDFVRFCADQNLDGCELTSYYFPKDFGNAYLIHLKHLTFRLGLDVSGTAIGNDFCHPDGAKRDEQLALTRKWIDAAALCGAPVIRIFAGNVQKGMTEEAAIQNCVRGIEESLKYAAEKGVILALENHGGITATPEQMLKIVRAIPANPWFGVNFDSGNFRTADPYADLEQIAPYAVNAQVKVEMFPNGKKAPADLERILEILKAARYRGYVVLEYEADQDPLEAVPGHLKTLRGLIGR
jgi:sugar phosphate isomerase/epimerase